MGKKTLPKIQEAIIVEGKYDKIKLSSIVDAVIIETAGFHIFKDPEQMAFIRKMASCSGIIILTDSDGAGFLIRNHLTGSIDAGQIKQAYIPDVYGKEKRKSAPSKEGKLGVEGVPAKVILEALARAGATFTDRKESRQTGEKLTKADLFDYGITGGENSSAKRRWLLHRLHLPERMTTNAMLRVINETMGREQLLQILQQYPMTEIPDREE